MSVFGQWPNVRVWRDEFLLAATAQNLRNLAKLLPFGPQALVA